MHFSTLFKPALSSSHSAEPTIMPSDNSEGSGLVSGPGVPYSTFLVCTILPRLGAITTLTTDLDASKGLSWASAAISTVFLAFRLAARWRGQRRLFWDDACSIFAGSLVIITAILWQWAVRDVYYVLNVAAGLAPVQADFAERIFRGLMVSLIVQLFFYTSLFVVKLSFLLFFRRLGSKVRGQGLAWWPALALSVVCYLVSVGDVQYDCSVNATLEHILESCTSPAAIQFTAVSLIINCVLDVLSGIASKFAFPSAPLCCVSHTPPNFIWLVLLIPFTLLWNVRIQKSRKLALLGLFSLSVITIALAIGRIADLHATKKSNNQQDLSYLWMWSSIQSSLGKHVCIVSWYPDFLMPVVAVAISCLSAFPQLFVPASRSANPQWSPTDTYYQRLRSRMKRSPTRRLDPLYDVSAFTLPDRDVEATHGERRHAVNTSGMATAAAQCSHSSDPHETSVMKSQIMRHTEFRITEQRNIEPARETAMGWQSPQGGSGCSYGSEIAGSKNQGYHSVGG